MRGREPLRERVRELERERVTVQQAAARLGITESAVRKRVSKGDLRSEKALEGNRERVYVFLDPDAEPFPEPFREKYMRSLEDRVKTLEDEVMRLQAIILSMSLSLRALTGAPEAPKRETTRPPATSAPTSRLGMSAWALAICAIATLLTWFYVSTMRLQTAFLPGFSLFIHIPKYLALAPTVLVPLLFGLWAGSTKRPSLPWFNSPHRWLRRGGRSALEFSIFAAGLPAVAGFVIAYVLPWEFTPIEIAGVGFMFAYALPFWLPVGSLAFMSGALLGNALRRTVGTPMKPPEGEDEGEQEEGAWSPSKEALWGLVGTLISALATVIVGFFGKG